jgi:hypothetical protein
MAKPSRQPAHHVQQAKAPARATSAPVIARRPIDAQQQAMGNQAMQRMMRAPAAGAPTVPAVSPDLERRLDAEAGGGEPLTREERSFFEPRFGRDLGHVRLHTDQQAAAAARDVNAQAFTRGQDVYFGEGQYQPHSDAGRRLMAHELTHTVQQSSSPDASVPDTPVPHAPAAAAAAAPLQRSAGAPVIRRQGDATPESPMSPKTGVLDEASETITFEQIEVPGFKATGHRKALYDAATLMRPKKYARGNPAQRQLWKDQIATGEIVSKLTALYNKATNNAPAPATYIFKNPSGQPRYYIGDLASIAKEMSTPYWTAAGTERRYDVDHIVEMQMGGDNALPNMELLDSKINSTSGSDIERNIKAKGDEFVKATNDKYAKSGDEVARKYNMKFTRAVAKQGPADVKSQDEYWAQEDIVGGKHIIDKISVETAESLDADKIARIFPSAGTPKQLTTGAIVPGPAEETWLKPYVMVKKELKTAVEDKDSTEFGSLSFTVPKKHKDWTASTSELDVPIKRIPGSQYAGTWNKSAVMNDLRTWRKTGLSPITIDELDITPAGMAVTGKISLDEISILQGVSIDFELSQGGLTFFKEFALGDFKIPKPFTIKESTLSVAVGTATGVKVGGRVDFGIDKVGDGYIGATVGTSDAFSLTGGFSFDPKLFAPPAKIDVTYTAPDDFKANGVLTIPEGKVKGLKKATVTASYAAGEFKATGSADLDMPAVKQASMEVKYSEAAGLDIKGKADLKDGLPGISSGTVEAEVKEGEDGWSVSASGKATSTIKGFDTALAISYTDGVFTAEATAGYKTEKLSGTMTVGLTNRAVDAEGKPTGGAADNLSAFGSGSIEATLTPWLKGTIGVRIKPEGGVIVSGKIGLPAPIDLFSEKKVDKELFSIGSTIPTPIPGVIVRIGGSLSAYASFGPGQLKDASIGVTYDPDHEEDTTITGSATFYVPAKAGLELGVSAGIGVGITGASVSGNLEIKGGLGIAGFASAEATVAWSPKQGLDLTATATAEASPAFTFKINGFFLVEALGFEIWKPTWNLASFEYGSSLTVGVSFPVHYHEGQEFSPKWEDVTFKKPEITKDTIADMLSGLLHATGF